MNNESQPDLFIRMLADALHTDRLARTGVWSPHGGSRVKAKTRHAKAEMDHAREVIGPLDCVQMMMPHASDRGRR